MGASTNQKHFNSIGWAIVDSSNFSQYKGKFYGFKTGSGGATVSSLTPRSRTERGNTTIDGEFKLVGDTPANFSFGANQEYYGRFEEITLSAGDAILYLG